MLACPQIPIIWQELKTILVAEDVEREAVACSLALFSILAKSSSEYPSKWQWLSEHMVLLL
jgi:hypothetical protein